MDVVFKKDRKSENSFSAFLKKIGEKIKAYRVPNAFYYFLVLIAIGVGFYFMMLIENGGTLAYGGDYSAQYIPMGYHIWDYYHEWIKTGHFTLFDPTLYLGANSLGSNSYYGLFSPFNIIIVILPRRIVPWSLAICSIVKLACAGLFFSLYMRKAFGVKERVAQICGIAYGFAGWGAFYLWYNNYQDILVFFPIVLLGIEKVLKEKKPWILAVGIFLLVICNYVLMVPYVICAFLYAMFRFFQGIRQNTVKENFIKLGFGAAAFITGLCMGMLVFAPAFMATLSSPKLDSYSYSGVLKTYLLDKNYKEFFELLFSWKAAPDQHGRISKYRVLYPIVEFFFPATTCRSLPTLELSNWDFDDMAVSLWCYVPFIMFLVPALIQSGKEKKWGHYVGFALILLTLFTPFMYFITMGAKNGYARWTLFIASSLIAYVGIYIDKIPNVAKWHMHVGFAFALLGVAAAWIITVKLSNQKWSESLNVQLVPRFLDEGKDYTTLAFILELVYVVIVYLALLFTYNRKAFHILATVFVAVEAIVMGNAVTYGHGWDDKYNNGYQQNEEVRKIISKIQKEDQSYYRFYTSINDAYSVNNSFINNYNTVSFFHSLYNFEIDDFTLWTGIRNGTKSVSGDYRGKYQDLDNLLGVKYYITSKEKSKYYLIEQNNPNGYLPNVPFDYAARDDLNDGDYLVYENPNIGEFGYSFNTLYYGTLPSADKWVRSDKDTIKNAMVLSTNAVVSKEDAEEITQLYPDITAGDVKPSTDSLRQLYKGTNYSVTYYELDHVAKTHPFDKIPNIPNEYEGKTEYGTAAQNNAMNYYSFYTPRTAGQPLFKEGTTLYIRAPFSGSEKYDVYFLDENNKIFMYDCHDDNTTDNTCYMRGFYLRRAAYKMAICGKYYQSYLTDNYTIRLYKEDYEDYETRRDALKDHPIENVTYKKDYVSFETNYDQNNFVVSRIAFDKGWSIKATDVETGNKTSIKVYKGNGGFISFVAPKGHYQYEMTYKTPYLKIGYIVSALSTLGFCFSLLAYHLYYEKKQYHYDKIFREN